jgi:hypothetical protein
MTYLDHAGSTLYSASQLAAVHRHLTANLIRKGNLVLISVASFFLCQIKGSSTLKGQYHEIF